MKLYKSERDIELVSDFDVVKKYPCVTVEKWNKWYSLYLVTEDGNVFKIEDEVYDYNKISSCPEIFTNEFKCCWEIFMEYGDHCWSPLMVLCVLSYFGIYIGEAAYKALVMMWAEQHAEGPGFEYDELPTKDLYDMVIVPDNGDIDNCNSFTEEERKQFRFFKENPSDADIRESKFREDCEEKINDYLIWKQEDAEFESVRNLALSLYTEDIIEGMDEIALRNKMLKEKHVDWANKSPAQKRGFCCTKTLEGNWIFVEDTPVFSFNPNFVNSRIGFENKGGK